MKNKIFSCLLISVIFFTTGFTYQYANKENVDNKSKTVEGKAYWISYYNNGITYSWQPLSGWNGHY